MSWLRTSRNSRDLRDRYATADDFENIFIERLDDLYQLSFLLTGGDHKKAERFFVRGLEDSVKAKSVFKQWARSWAKRTIVQNAIRELNPRPCARDFSQSDALALYPDSVPVSPTGHFELSALLRLPDFDRLVFVMSVLERYSAHSSALLLGRPVQEVREAQARAIAQLCEFDSSLAVSSETQDTEVIHDAYSKMCGFSIEIAGRRDSFDE
jgi:DNA-directed RNA polymerase specialized sigma24 family protein